ncbi:MAG: TrkA C-terminal domain-containing protein, partial [Muribaculaceae bacterium]|nr:TrkA C-terminal domain-containing protein [Muribaculaceae bacterium]
AYIEVGPSSPFVGDRLRDSGLRRDYGVSISSIQRGDDYMPLPSADARIFPGDVLGVIGTDDQLKALNEALEGWRKNCVAPTAQPKVELSSITLTDNSPIIGMPLSQTDIQKDYYSMLVKIQRGEEKFIQPTPDVVLRAGDTIWVVGDPSQIDRMKA